MVLSLSLNLSCAQLGEGDFLNLITARSLLTLVERVAAQIFTALEGCSMPTPPAAPY
jgi:hypothetical protein